MAAKTFPENMKYEVSQLQYKMQFIQNMQISLVYVIYITYVIPWNLRDPDYTQI